MDGKDLQFWIRKLEEEGDLYLKIKVNPRKKQRQVRAVLEDSTWIIDLKSAPEKGKANQELVFLLSEIFRIPKGRVMLLSGYQSRIKLVHLYV